MRMGSDNPLLASSRTAAAGAESTERGLFDDGDEGGRAALC